MPSYKAPNRDFRFIINEMLEIESYGNLPGFENASAEMVTAILEEGGKFASAVVAPLYRVGDAEGCKRHAGGPVTTPTGVKEAVDLYREAGWGTLPRPEERTEGRREGGEGGSTC